MAISFDDLTLDDNQSGLEILDVNWQTTAALGLGVATGGVTAALMLTAFPAQTLAAAGGIGVLAYAGKRRADGLEPFPFGDKDEKSESKKDSKVKQEAPAAA